MAWTTRHNIHMMNESIVLRCDTAPGPKPGPPALVVVVTSIRHHIYLERGAPIERIFGETFQASIITLLHFDERSSIIHFISYQLLRKEEYINLQLFIPSCKPTMKVFLSLFQAVVLSWTLASTVSYA